MLSLTPDYPWPVWIGTPASDDVHMELRDHIANGRDVDFVALVFDREHAPQDRCGIDELFSQVAGQIVPCSGVDFRDENEPADLGIFMEQNTDALPCPEVVAIRSQGGV